jgi:hypothetical protein
MFLLIKCQIEYIRKEIRNGAPGLPLAKHVPSGNASLLHGIVPVLLKTAFPDRGADEMYTIMIAVRLSRLLGDIDGCGMFGLRDILNAVLAARIGYVVTGVEDTDYGELYRQTAELRIF